MNSCVQIPSNYFNCNLFDLTFPQMNTNASKEILKGTIDGLRFELGVWLHPNILKHRDYKFLLRSNQIRRIKSGVIFQPSTECNVNKLY